jgi:hypothetical protein
MAPRFVELASDPTLIPGVYNYCDQWCAYCRVTHRCLAYRCLEDRTNRHPGDIFTDMAGVLNEMIDFARRAVGADGAPNPGLERLAALPQLEPGPLPAIDDPLERLGRQYAMETSRFLMTTASAAGASLRPSETGGARPAGPAPLEVVMWYHVLIAVKIFRGLVSSKQADLGQPNRGEDALGSIKVALIGIDRSRKALRQLLAATHNGRIVHLMALLDRLGPALEARFPGARAFVRDGLDAADA